MLDPESHRKRLRLHKDLHPVKFLKKISGTVSHREDHLLRPDHGPICELYSGNSAVFLQDLRDFRAEMDLSASGDDPVSQISDHFSQHVGPDVRCMVIKDRRIRPHLHKGGEDFSVPSRSIFYKCI